MRIVIIGSGSVATYFGKRLVSHHHKIPLVISRNRNTGSGLANELGADFRMDTESIPSCDLLLLAVNDDSIIPVSAGLDPGKAIVAHTAGAMGIRTLSSFPSSAVIYPLQSMKSTLFTENVNILLETSGDDVSEIISGLLSSCGLSCSMADSLQRLQYHLSAVFTNNFPNAFFGVAEKISAEAGLNYELLRPLISKTFETAFFGNASDSQTGPAFRGDHATMEKHLELLSGNPGLQNIYRVMSDFIIQSKEKDH